jgi:stalled ribosome alternative rescue factor ArfA
MIRLCFFGEGSYQRIAAAKNRGSFPAIKKTSLNGWFNYLPD